MPPRKLPPNEVIISLYRAGLSCPEIAEQFHVSPLTVTSLLRRIGEPRRSTKEAAIIRQVKGRTRVGRFWLGKKQPPEMVEKRASKIRGENHYLWKGGAETRPYRKLVRKDQCTLCGSKEKLLIHHIDFDHYNNAADNLQVLCLRCHSSVHKQAYWNAVHAGEEPPYSTAPNHWRTREGDVNERSAADTGECAFNSSEG
jgi:5-methylcytosine-specific restriction endonuclease McrA